jgi:branched-chain amino acid aminotransferase
MPHVSGITPRVLLEKGVAEKRCEEGVERLTGTFKIDEIGLPAFDHGALYGDAVFEGVLIVNRGLFQWREHLQRLYTSAGRLHIEIPYTLSDLTQHILEAVNDTDLPQSDHAYIRLVVTRGIGDLGIHPARCTGSTVYSIISTIQLYPESVYQRGIRLSLSTKTRRPGPMILDPQIKSCNYLNNIMALLETLPQACNETVMLNTEGFVAEATTDNLFLVIVKDGWESDAARITLVTPSSNYCLKGITRGIVLTHAKKLGVNVVESARLLPQDLVGPHREVFLTGTAAGLVPVIAIDGREIGDGLPGPFTKTLRDLLSADMKDPNMALSLDAQRKEIDAYLKKTAPCAAPLVIEDTPLGTNLVTRLFDLVDSRDWKNLNQVFCEDITYERPGYEPLVGFERVARFYREERVIASGKHHLENIVLNEDSGACWGRFVGVHKNNSAIDERFADVYRFKDGRIKNRQSYFFRPAV